MGVKDSDSPQSLQGSFDTISEGSSCRVSFHRVSALVEDTAGCSVVLQPAILCTGFPYLRIPGVLPTYYTRVGNTSEPQRLST
jgi:hypothetical protein